MFGQNIRTDWSSKEPRLASSGLRKMSWIKGTVGLLKKKKGEKNAVFPQPEGDIWERCL
jgi:hypothetical protein